MIHLDEIMGPDDIKGLDFKELAELAEEIREAIIKHVSQSGGHLASSLGVVELTLALHYAFESPRDRIVWDVGHQCYPHKMLTGRYDRFDTLRKFKGLGGFPKRAESPHDAFDTGHSSTSISAALGMVEGRDQQGRVNKVIAVIGDGAMTAGLAFEGLNHAGQLRKDLIVVLNDNEMSISKNVGAMSQYLNRILTGDIYNKFKRETRLLLEGIPKLGGPVARFAEKLEESIKGLVLPGMLFEELGFNYVGPINGHDLEALVGTLNKIKAIEKPVLLHIITTKGKGYEFSEDDPSSYHGVGPFEPETGSPSSKGGAETYGDVLGSALIEAADKGRNIVAISAAMKEGTGLARFAERYPKRFYDVGIAEPHAVTFAAGIAAEGVRPVVAIYSTFLQRSYDEIIHDVCLQGLPVLFAIDRAGIVGEDGPTHQGLFDISYLRHIPGLCVMAPKDAPEMSAMIDFALSHDGPVALRYPRGKAISMASECAPIEMGRAETLQEGSGVAVLAIGNMVAPAMEAAQSLESRGIRPSVINMRFIKPLDTQLIECIAKAHKAVVTVEENVLQGGLGSAVLEHLGDKGMMPAKFLRIGIPDEYVEQGTQAELRKLYGLDPQSIANAIASLSTAI